MHMPMAVASSVARHAHAGVDLPAVHADVVPAAEAMERVRMLDFQVTPETQPVS